MEIPLRRAPLHGRVIETTLPNGYSIKHTPERNLPGGGNWVVQKFGGTSIGKFAVSIANDIVLAGIKDRRIAIVCSARSTKTKSEGTTNRLLRAARDTLVADSREYADLVEAIRADHVATGQLTIKDHAILKAYIVDVDTVCQKLLKILEAAQFLRAVTNQTSDMVISVGEKLSCLYMTALLQDRGGKAAYVDLSEVITFPVGKVIDEQFYKNLSVAIASRINVLEKDCIPVITGYFGNVPGGLLEQIGRGYTDLCAALAAVGLNAAELQIWKEVDGIFTADPRKVPTARLVDSVTPAEAAELTFYGSEVIHPFTMDQVIKASIPIRIKNVMNPRGKGTVILPDPAATVLRKPVYLRNRSVSNLTRLGRLSHPKRPTAVTIKSGITVLNVHSKKRTRAHGFLMSIFSTLDQHGLSVDLISSSEVHVSMALHSENSMLAGADDELKIESEALQAAVDDLSKWGEVDLVGGMCIISLVGRQLNSMVGISGRFFSTLGEHGINIEMISQGASEINISCVIEEKDANRALSVVHTSLFTFLE